VPSKQQEVLAKSLRNIKEGGEIRLDGLTITYSNEYNSYRITMRSAWTKSGEIYIPEKNVANVRALLTVLSSMERVISETGGTE